MPKLTSIYKFLLLQVCYGNSMLFNEGNRAEIVYHWTSLEYEWTEQTRQQFINNGSFIINHNIIAGVKVYGKRVFVTVPRWREGIPSTLNEVIKNGKGKLILRPFPNWTMQTIGNCDSFQYVQSMEVDTNTGHMWIIDSGRTNTFSKSGGTSRCRPKIVVMDIDTETIVTKHIFPEDVVSRSGNFLNDLVIDYVNGEARFAYISDEGDNTKLIVFDFKENKSYFFQHSSMYALSSTTIKGSGNSSLNLSVPIDGIAMSPDFRYVYYCTLADKMLYRVPTEILRSRENFNYSVEFVGKKPSYSGGIMFSQKSLYYGDLQNNMIYRYQYNPDQPTSNFEREQQPLFDKPLPSLEWVDTFAIDSDGNLWFVTNKAVRFFNNKMDFNDGVEPNMYIWKVAIGEHSYLINATSRTHKSNSAYNLDLCLPYVLMNIFVVCLSILYASNQI